MKVAPDGVMRCGLARAMVVVFVCLTAAVSLAWSHAKLLSQDEMYQFQTDSVGSLAELVHVQKTWPISLDPLLDHALSHGAMQVFGANAFAQRLPALAGISADAGVPVLLGAQHGGRSRGGGGGGVSGADGDALLFGRRRPYGLMLGLYALALLVLAEVAVDRDQLSGKAARRKWALVGLAAGDCGDDQCALLRGSAAGAGVCGGGVADAGAAADRLAGVRRDRCGDGGVCGDSAVYEGGGGVPQELLQRRQVSGCTTLRGRTGRSLSTTRR